MKLLTSAIVLIALAFSSGSNGFALKTATEEAVELSVHPLVISESSSQKDSNARWKSIRSVEFELAARGTVALARIAHNSAGKILSCFSEQPEKLDIAAAKTHQVRFGSNRYHCVDGLLPLAKFASGKTLKRHAGNQTLATLNVKDRAVEEGGALPVTAATAPSAPFDAVATLVKQPYIRAQALVSFVDEDGEYVDFDFQEIFDYFDNIDLTPYGCSGFGLDSCPTPPPPPNCQGCWDKFMSDIANMASSIVPGGLEFVFFAFAINDLRDCLLRCQ